MSRGRYAVGWAVLAVAAPCVALTAVAVGRGAMGDTAVVDALSPAQVTAALSAAGTSTALPQSSGPSTGSTPHPSGTRPATSGTPSTGASAHGTTGPGQASHVPGSSSPSTRPTTRPSPSGSPAPTSSPTTALLTSPGGSVVAQCSGSGGRTVYLVSWSPAQGFTVNSPVQRGPGQEAEIEFESDRASYSVHVTCHNGVPVQTWGGDSGGGGGPGD